MERESKHPPKSASFLLDGYLDKVLTLSHILQRNRKLVIVNACIMCRQEVEDVLPLFIHGSYVEYVA